MAERTEMSARSGSESEPDYRWVIVAASAVMLAISMGMMVNGFSVFFIPLNEEFGWQRGAVSLINFSGLLGLALGGILMGRIADRTSTRRVCLFGSIVLGLCIVGASYAEALWQFYLLFFVGGFLGAGSLFAPLVANVGSWFKSGAGLALGITAAGQAIGQGGVPYVIAILIGAVGWRDALMTTGVATLIGLVLMAMLLRQPPHRTPAATGGDAATDSELSVLLPSNVVARWLGAAVLFCCICMSVPLMHLVPLVQDRGFPLEDAGSVIFLMLLVAIIGRVAFGKLADMIGAIRAYWIASCWQTLLVFGFVHLDTLDGFYIFAVVYGFGYAGVMTGILVCVRVLTPISRRASVLGFVMLFAWLGHGVGGYQGGLFFDITGNYTVSYGNAAVAGIVNLIIVGSLYFAVMRRRSAWRSQIEAA
jgi:MFS family permease